VYTNVLTTLLVSGSMGIISLAPTKHMFTSLGFGDLRYRVDENAYENAEAAMSKILNWSFGTLVCLKIDP